MTVRILHKGDEAPLENFLKDHAETSMFLRSNMRKVGIEYKNAAYHGDYYGSFDDSGAIKGVLAHYWNNNLMTQAPDKSVLTDLVNYFRSQTTRPIGGILGPDAQVLAVINDLAIPETAFGKNSKEGLYTLDLDKLAIPANHDAARYKMVAARDIGKAILTDWLKGFNIEALGSDDNEELSESINNDVALTMKEDRRWALIFDEKPVALSGFNAQLPDIVQIGPVWTPPEHRSNGYARMIVALSLQQAKECGVKSSVLVADNPPAIKAYESIGYQKNGSFRLSLLKQPMSITQKMAL